MCVWEGIMLPVTVPPLSYKPVLFPCPCPCTAPCHHIARLYVLMGPPIQPSTQRGEVGPGDGFGLTLQCGGGGGFSGVRWAQGMALGSPCSVREGGGQRGEVGPGDGFGLTLQCGGGGASGVVGSSHNMPVA